MRSSTLRTTVSDDVKRKFVARCRELNMSKSEVLRLLIHSFLMNPHSLMTDTAATAETHLQSSPQDPSPSSSEEKLDELTLTYKDSPSAINNHFAQPSVVLEKHNGLPGPVISEQRLTIFGREYVLKAPT
jgi:antitoxin component of RelBE/YafQ-DinJ toxin-antitoxin module